jgi:hypothetical protein
MGKCLSTVNVRRLEMSLEEYRRRVDRMRGALDEAQEARKNDAGG